MKTIKLGDGILKLKAKKVKAGSWCDKEYPGVSPEATLDDMTAFLGWSQTERILRTYLNKTLMYAARQAIDENGKLDELMFKSLVIKEITK